MLGQNVNSYGLDNQEINFAELLFKVNNIDGVERIKFVTSHPRDFSDAIIHAVFTNKKVCPIIHLPLQSGSNRILQLMNRKYTIEQYDEIVNKIKAFKQSYSLSTDLLIGFPGETESDFLQTIEAIKKIKFTEAFTFKYSARPNIQANNLKDAVSEELKSERLNHLIETQKNIEKGMITNNLHQIRNVLIESTSKKDKGKFKGRDELNYIVVVDKPVKIGEFHKVEIIDIHGITLIGRIIS